MNGSDSMVDECAQEGDAMLLPKLLLNSVVGLLIGAFGFFGNFTTVIIFSKPGMRTPNNLLLIALAVFDNILIVTALLLYAVENVFELLSVFWLHELWLTYVRAVFTLSNVAQTGSVYITVAVTVERLLAIVLPSIGGRCCNRLGAFTSIALVSLFAVSFNAGKYFEVTVVRTDCTNGSWHAWRLAPGPLAFDPVYQTVHVLYLSNAVMVFVPFVALLTSNVLIGLKVQHSVKLLRQQPNCNEALHQQLREKSREATIVLVAIVCIFLVCNLWSFVLTLLERVVLGPDFLAGTYPTFYAFSREAINFLAMVNSSANFLIYCIFGKDFRMRVKRVYSVGRRRPALRPRDDSYSIVDKFETWRMGTFNASQESANVSMSPGNFWRLGMKRSVSTLSHSAIRADGRRRNAIVYSNAAPLNSADLRQKRRGGLGYGTADKRLLSPNYKLPARAKGPVDPLHRRVIRFSTINVELPEDDSITDVTAAVAAADLIVANQMATAAAESRKSSATTKTESRKASVGSVILPAITNHDEAISQLVDHDWLQSTAADRRAKFSRLTKMERSGPNEAGEV